MGPRTAEVIPRIEIDLHEVGRGDKRSRLREALGILGLFGLYTMLWLAGWALVPSLVLGWKSVVITSGSMQPAFNTGDVIVASPPKDDLAPGTVVVFQDTQGRLITHRITAVNDDGSYVTRGDANAQNDSTPLTADKIVGVGRILVPMIGLPLVWLGTGSWAKLILWALTTSLILGFSRWAWTPITDLGKSRAAT
jgi:signal peptidase